jgi:imidazole glycerol-phosphate synthase subunit HisH
MITIVDYGMGNVGSIQNMFKRIGVASSVASTPEQVARAARLVLPGVGAFDRAMAILHERGLAAALDERVAAGVPILGICLGMQLMTRSSEEGQAAGLGWIAARTVRFLPRYGGVSVKVPHMRWNTIRPAVPGTLFDPDETDARFYFVHSYCVECDDPADVAATAVHGREFVCAFQRGSVMGVQFHPEKSHRYGMRLLERFAAYEPALVPG